MKELNKHTSSQLVYDLVLTSINEAKNAPHLKSAKESMPLDWFYRQCRTISISLPRGLGITTAALNLINTTNSILISPNNMILRYTNDLAVTGNIYVSYKIIPMHDLQNKMMPLLDEISPIKRRFDMVIFDPVTSFTSSDVNKRDFEQAKMLASSVADFIVLLG